MARTIQEHLRQQRPFDSIEAEVFVGVHLVADRLMEPWAGHLRRAAGLSPAQYNVLRILRGAGDSGALTGEVAERLISRSPDVTRLVDRLQRRGLVARAQDPDDRRAVRLTITRSGRERLAPLDEVARTLLDGLLADVDPRVLATVRDGLAEILDALAGKDGRTAAESAGG